METKNVKEKSKDESSSFHLDPNRVRTEAEVATFAAVFRISREEARRILTSVGRQCEKEVEVV